MYHKLINEDEYENAFEFKNRSKERRNNGSSTELDSNRYDIIEHNIQPNETLQGIALRYNCSVSQLRLFNNIISDQDFYILKKLRVDVPKHSCRTECVDQSRTEFVNDLVNVSDESGHSISSKTQVINIGISKYLNEHDNYQQFLNNLSSDLEALRKFNENKMETSAIISDNRVNEDWYINTNTSYSKLFNYCDGSDYGIHWKYLILLIIFICLLVPLYVLYNLEHHNST